MLGLTEVVWPNSLSYRKKTNKYTSQQAQDVKKTSFGDVVMTSRRHYNVQTTSLERQ